MLNQTFIIIDKFRRQWGRFTVQNVAQSPFGGETTSGYLEPFPSFKDVRGIFLRHEKSVADGIDDDVWKEIVDLQAYLLEENTNKIYYIDDVIFIGENFLVTCKIGNESLSGDKLN